MKSVLRIFRNKIC